MYTYMHAYLHVKYHVRFPLTNIGTQHILVLVNILAQPLGLESTRSQLLRQQSGNIQDCVRNKRLLQQCTASALQHSVNGSCLKLSRTLGDPQQKQQQRALANTTQQEE